MKTGDQVRHKTGGWEAVVAGFTDHYVLGNEPSTTIFVISKQAPNLDGEYAEEAFEIIEENNGEESS